MAGAGEGSTRAPERLALRAARELVVGGGGASGALRLREAEVDAAGVLLLEVAARLEAAFRERDLDLVDLGFDGEAEGGLGLGCWIQSLSGPMNQYVLLLESCPIGSRR